VTSKGYVVLREIVCLGDDVQNIEVLQDFALRISKRWKQNSWEANKACDRSVCEPNQAHEPLVAYGDNFYERSVTVSCYLVLVRASVPASYAS
jgi:hypothetical protein